MYRTAQNYDNKPFKCENQPYFQKKHYLSFLDDYQRVSISSLTGKKNNNQLLIIAKAYFIKKQYKQTIKILSLIPLDTNTYILYERQTLLFKAHYLLFFISPQLSKISAKQAHIMKHQTLQNLKTILQNYSLNRTLLPGTPLNKFHAEAITQMQMILEWYQRQDQLVDNQQQKIQRSMEKIGGKYQQKVAEVQQEEETFYKQLGKKKIFQGMPSYLVQRAWLSKYEKYIKKVGDHPGPITNFCIINHVANMLHYEDPSKAYLNILIFPLSPEDDYVTISSAQWKVLFKKYHGIPVKRVVSRIQSSYSRRNILTAADTLIKVLVKLKKPQQNWVIQFSNNFYWQKHAAETLQKFFGQGQLKEYKWQGSPQMQQFTTVIPQNQVQRIEHPLQFYKVQFWNKRLQPNDQKRKIKLLRKYNLQPYKIASAVAAEKHKPISNIGKQNLRQNRIPTGLYNLSNSCYLNSSLQCLRNIDVLNQYFVQNGFIKDLNFTESNKLGSYGQVTCALADTFKGLHMVNDQKYGFSPDVFKDAFGRRYQDFNNFEQQDANQFLSFLLNCLHDDLNINSSNKARKISVSQRNFEAVRDCTMENQNARNKSLITDLFQGYHYSQIYCQVCEDRIHRFDIFLMLTLPLPPLADNIKLYFVEVLNINIPGDKHKNSQLLTIYTAGFKIVKDLVSMVTTRHLKDKTKKAENYLMLCLDDKSFEVDKQIDLEMDIENLIKLYKIKKYLFFLYEKPEIQNKQTQILTIVDFKYNKDRIGYPRLLVTDRQIQEDNFLKKINRFLDDLGYLKEKESFRSTIKSAKQKQQQQNMKACDTMKSEQIKSKGYSYSRRIKIYLNRRYKLCFFNQITDAIGDSHNNMKYDLDTCFKISTEKQRIDQREGWRCQRCRDKTVAFKQETLFSVGQVLIICLKRFSQGQKINARIDYPVNGLDISQYKNQGKGSKISTGKQRQDANFKKPQIFDLQSVCIHRGTLHRGHYISYCKNPYDKKWYCFDDESVREIPQESVVSQNAYILFYRRRNQSQRVSIM